MYLRMTRVQPQRKLPNLPGSLETGIEDVDTVLLIFFFQAEDGIRDLTVTGVQTCALPISVLFAIGFIVRPIGGWLFGHLADRSGRRMSLMLAMLLMCFATMTIALIPTYEIGRASCRERV